MGVWCEDTYHKNYEGAPIDGSPWTEGGEEWERLHRVIRGGCWNDGPVICRSAFRLPGGPVNGGSPLGFRPCIWPSDD